MIAEAEPTGAGLKAMTDEGWATVSFAYGVGEASLLITLPGGRPLEIPMRLAVLNGFWTAGRDAETNARILAETHGAEPMVPRNARATVSATA